MSIWDQLREGRIGRVPVWAVGVGLAGLIIVIVIIRSRMRANQEGDQSPEVVGTEDPTVDGIPTQSFADQLSNRFPSNVGTVPPALNRPVTNLQWLTIAFDYLVGLGKIPGVAQRALQDYLAGKPLSPEQQQLVDIALANSTVSLPPEGVGLPGATTPTTTTPTTTPTEMPQYVQAPVGISLYGWAQGLQSTYGSQAPNFERMFGSFKGDPSALNPSHRNYMLWTGAKGSTLTPTFKAGTPNVRLR